MRRVWIGAGIALLVGIVIGWQIRDWEWRWGSAAEWAAAIGVFAALIYAAQQIEAAERQAQRRRHDELLDRLEVAAFDDLVAAVNEQMAAWRRARDVVMLLHLTFVHDDPPDAQEVRKLQDELFTRSRPVLDAERRVHHLVFRIRRLLARLNLPDAALQSLRSVLDDYSATELPSDADGVRAFATSGLSRRKVAHALDQFLASIEAVIVGADSLSDA